MCLLQVLGCFATEGKSLKEVMPQLEQMASNYEAMGLKFKDSPVGIASATHIYWLFRYCLLKQMPTVSMLMLLVMYGVCCFFPGM